MRKRGSEMQCKRKPGRGGKFLFSLFCAGVLGTSATRYVRRTKNKRERERGDRED